MVNMRIKTIFLFLLNSFLMLYFVSFSSCKKDDDPNDISDLPTCTDIDGNVYHLLKIGSQTWMVENLKTTKYRNGDDITNITDFAGWGAATEGAYCQFNNGINDVSDYGKLYNWRAVHDTRGLAPDGYHIPSEFEWRVMFDYLGIMSQVAVKLKEKGFNHWTNENVNATNETGFTALPGGNRDENGDFSTLREVGWWWTTDDGQIIPPQPGTVVSMRSWDDGVVINTRDVRCGISVRCIKD
jgi:uncharacterized protein (TIGR02145 family)